MNDITYAVSVDVNNPIIPYNVYVASVLDSNVRYLEITLYQNGNVIALSNTATATASLVTDNVLVNDSVNCTISDSIITVPLEDLQRHGNLDVQVTVTEGTKVLAIPFPIQVRVTPNIAENAQINENSLGSYAEVVQEIAAARGTHTTLHDAITAKLDDADGSVKENNIADESITVEKVANDLAAVINAKEVKSNKKTTLTGNESSNDFYPTTKAVADALSSYSEIVAQALSSCSEIVAEIAAARGDYDNLAQALSHLMGFLNSEIVNNATDTGKIYYTTTKKALIIPVSTEFSQTQFRLDRDGKIYARRRSRPSTSVDFPEWGSFVDISVGVDPETIEGIIRQIVEAYIAEHGIDLTGVERTANKVTAIGSGSTDTQYPSAKAVYNAIQTAIGTIETQLSQV